jgi:hypothetical protein
VLSIVWPADPCLSLLKSAIFKGKGFIFRERVLAKAAFSKIVQGIRTSMNRQLERKTAVIFSWHSSKNIDLLLPLLDFLDQQGNYDTVIITTDATGKFRLIEQGYDSYTVNELLFSYPNDEGYRPTPTEFDNWPIDLALDWLHTPADPVNIPGPPREQSPDYFQWKHHALINAYVSFLKDTNADVVMTWNGSLLVTRALAEAAHAISITTFFLERGLLPQSLVFDPLGVNSQSSIAGPDWKEFAAEDKSGQAREELIEYCHSLEKSQLSIVNTGSRESQDKVREILEINNDQPIVLLPLQIETDSNIIYNSPLYKAMANLIKDVVAAISGQDVLLIVKPHPEDKIRRETIEALCTSEQVRVCWDLTLPSILSVTDLVIVINSTVGLESLIQNKPVVALGRSIYDRKGFTHDVFDRDELGDTLKNALAAPLYPHENSDFWRFLLTLMCHHTFFFSPSSNLDGRSWLQEILPTLPRNDSLHTSTLALQALNQTNTLLRKLLNEKDPGRYLVFGPLPSAVETIPSNVDVIIRQTPKLHIIKALFQRYDAVICTQMPASRLFRAFFWLLRAQKKITLG